MREAAILFFCNMTAAIACGWAGYLALHDKDGWGWFLIVAVIATHGWSSTKDDE